MLPGKNIRLNFKPPSKGIGMSTPTKKIVVVEDEPDTAEMFAEMMRLSGYEVLKCYGGTTAIALITQEKPDAIVMDLMMPDLSGMEVIRHLRQNPRLSTIPIIVVSAKGLPSDIKQGLDAGAMVYLTKPVSYIDLKEAVEHAVKNYRKDAA